MARAPTVGLSIIARDEELDLPALLESIEGAFDQVVLCDTGSRDRTVALFEQWAARQQWPDGGPLPWKVGHFDWIDDFAAARNHADSLLDTEWSTWADCDDVVRGASNLRALARNAPPETAVFLIGYDYAQLPDDTTISYQVAERLVRRSKSLGWENRVHETQHLEGAAAWVDREICEWVHRGWTFELDTAPSLPERNLRILHRWIEDEPHNLVALAYLGPELHLRGRHRDALRWFKRYLSAPAIPGLEQHRAQTLCRAASSQLALRQPRKAIRLALEAIELLPSWTDSYLVLAQANMALGGWEQAARWARETIRRGAPNTTLSVNPLDYTFRSRVVLASALAAMGRRNEAIAVGQHALEYVPSHDAFERQLASWKLGARERSPARRLPRLAAAVAATAGALLVPGAGVAAAKPYNELEAGAPSPATFLGVPIIPPSTVSVRTVRIEDVHAKIADPAAVQVNGGLYRAALAIFKANGQPGSNFLLPSFGQTAATATSVVADYGSNFAAVDASVGGSIVGITQGRLQDPECRLNLGNKRPEMLAPISFRTPTFNGFVAVTGGFGQPETPFIGLFNPVDCRLLGSVNAPFGLSGSSDLRGGFAMPNGIITFGGVTFDNQETATGVYAPAKSLIPDWQHGDSALHGGIPLLGQPGVFTSGIQTADSSIDLAGYDRTTGQYFIDCYGPSGAPDGRCGPGGRYDALNVDPVTSVMFPPQITLAGAGQAIVSIPYTAPNGTAHVDFVRINPTNLAVIAQRNISYAGTTLVPGVLFNPSTGNTYVSMTTRNLFDPNNPLNDNRVKVALYTPGFDVIQSFTPDLSKASVLPVAPDPGSEIDETKLDEIFTRPFKASLLIRAGDQAGAAAATRSRIIGVQVAILRLAAGSTAAHTTTCAWLTDRRLHFKRSQPVRGRCEDFVFLKASPRTGGRWSLRLAKPLPPGNYVVYSRATNAAGATERNFSSHRRNELSFRVRR